jgi:hypothetical protein
MKKKEVPNLGTYYVDPPKDFWKQFPSLELPLLTLADCSIEGHLVHRQLDNVQIIVHF